MTPSLIGTKLAHYEVTSHLGSGGMGEVYQASDLKLGRSVAIKFLPDAFALDEERRTRFEREARVLASLNHPHIAAIYGLEESGSRMFLVMELVTGETLAQRIARGPIPVDDALATAGQIAEALEAAHEKGIVHRDLKPANIKVTSDGQVKVLDFGLAKALAGDAEADLSNSPTMSRMVSHAGVILGTAAYMSPEQAQGKEVDRRTDIFAFGCVLFEMLTRRQTFQGESVTEVLAGVLKSEPDWSRLPEETPPVVRWLLRRCLHKDRSRRLQYSADLRIEIEDARVEPGVNTTGIGSVRSRRRERWAWIAAAAFAIALAAVLGLSYFSVPGENAELRVDIVTPSTADPFSFAISPDGRRIVFAASGDGQPRLWLRSLDAVTAQPIAGTEGGSFPFWSPESRSIGFFAGGKLKRVDIGGSPQELADASLGRGGTWSPDGILFCPNAGSPLFRVAASGGAPVQVTKLEEGQMSHRFPHMLPGGRRFLFFASGGAENVRGIYLGSLDSSEARRLTAADGSGSFLPPGWLLFVREETLVAWRFNPETAELAGDPVTLRDPVGLDTVSRASAVSVSASGSIAYRLGTATRRQLTWFDRSGKALGTVGQPDENGLADPELSPDGTRIAVDRNAQNNPDVWLLDGARRNRFTFDEGQDSLPIWSPDGTRIVFRSNRKGILDLFEKQSSSAGDEQLLISSGLNKTPNDWSRDGRSLLYSATDPKTDGDLWVLQLDKDRKPVVFLSTRSAERAGQFSPDGRWVAYQSNESGQYEIYVRPFPAPGGQWQVSSSGGIQARWHHDGKELYYLAPDGRIMAVPIVVNGATLDLGDPVPLFQPRMATTTASSYRAQYDVAPNGRFLINVTAEDATTPPITLLLNWKLPAN